MAALRDDEAYGYQIVERLGRMPGLEVTESTVYPVLARLARDRFVTGRTATPPTGPPRRYYRLSAGGQRRLEEMIARWQCIQNSVNQLTQGALNDGRFTKSRIAETHRRAARCHRPGIGWRANRLVGTPEHR